jgi:hypothetical protein
MYIFFASLLCFIAVLMPKTIGDCKGKILLCEQ